MVGGGRSSRGAAAFSRLARKVVRRPWVPIALWVVAVVVALPFLTRLGGVTTNSTESLPSSAPSAIAEARLGELFPNSTGGSSTILLFYGPNVTGPGGQALVMRVTEVLATDRGLDDVGSVESVYTQYAGYLAGEVELAAGTVEAAQSGTPNLTGALNQTANLLWGPPALFVENWQALVAANTSRPANQSNAPAYNETSAELGNSTEGLAILSAFYAGYNGSATGFNGSAGACAARYPNLTAVAACADASARSNVGPLAPHLAGTNQTLDAAALAGLGVGNATAAAAQRLVAGAVLSQESGLPSSWLLRVWAAFGGGPVTPSRASSYAQGLVNTTTLAAEPLAVPPALASLYVNDAGSASVVSVTFTVADDATNASGGTPVVHDLGEIDRDVRGILASYDANGQFGYYQTGPAPLDALTTQVVNSSLALVLPLTVGLLLGIAMLYFRSPIAPLVAFAGLGVALLLGLGGTVLLGTIVTHVDSSALVLEEVFVLGVGTDYSIFLVARYREELVRGRSSDEALVAAVTWAGQSIATSGSTAIIVTVALTFSGVALLAQWGMVLSLAILITMLVALTLLPACLRLLGPRVFWPITGRRFEAAARANNERAAQGTTYFYRAARLARSHPVWIVGVIVGVSLPLVAVALGVPISYDFYGQLPAGHPATSGLAELGEQFGPGFAVPSFALVTFANRLVTTNTTNATEFVDLAELGLLASSTEGIASVRSPVGPYGASLAEWLSLDSEPPGQRANLLAALAPYVGLDGRTVLFQLQTNATGLSYAAVSAVDRVESAFQGYAGAHPEITTLAFGGGAPVIGDLAGETEVATEVMLVAVTVGLVLVLLAVLRSWIIALMAVATIGLSISWAWALTDLVLQQILGVPIFFYVRTILIMLVLGLGIDYNIFLLTRVREERIRGQRADAAVFEAVGRTGGIITAAAVILACAFAALLAGEFTLIRAIGFSVAVAVVMDAMVVRTYLVPASLQLLHERAWSLSGRPPTATPSAPAEGGSGLS
jgi:uncharacterized membrane protein YdfJ with MMPL/SSD domain